MNKSFNEIRDRYNQRLQELQNERESLQNSLQGLQGEYIRAMEELAPASQLLEIQEHLEDIQERLSKGGQLDRAIQLTKQGKRKALLQQIPQIRAYFDRKREHLQADFDAELIQFYKHKANMLLSLQELSRRSNKVSDLFHDLEDVKSEVDDVTRNFLQPPLENIPMDQSPSYVGMEPASRSLTAGTWLIKQVQQGKLPKWVEHFKATGRLPEEPEAKGKVKNS